MKRGISIVLIIAMAAMLFAGGETDRTKNRRITTEAMTDSESQALRVVPIPEVSYFNERKTIASISSATATSLATMSAMASPHRYRAIWFRK